MGWLLLRYRGPADTESETETESDMVCEMCKAVVKSGTVYRCRECWDSPVVCRRCMVSSHRRNPLHFVEDWNRERGFWRRTTLYNLGMEIFLGHKGQMCVRSVGPPREICIVGMTGIQEATVGFCRCEGKDDYLECKQLMDVGLWPATWKVCRTVFSLEVLDHFAQLSTQGNVTAQDFLRTLEQKTDGVLPDTVKVGACLR